VRNWSFSPFFRFGSSTLLDLPLFIYSYPLSYHGPILLTTRLSHHNFSVAPIFIPLPTLLTTYMHDVTFTNTRSLLIIFHSSACGTLITLLSIPHLLASRVHSWNPSFFVAPGYYRKTRIKLTFWWKSGTSSVAANTHTCQTLNVHSCWWELSFISVKLYYTSFRTLIQWMCRLVLVDNWKDAIRDRKQEVDNWNEAGRNGSREI